MCYDSLADPDMHDIDSDMLNEHNSSLMQAHNHNFITSLLLHCMRVVQTWLATTIP